jgi:glutathione S-transferase
LNAPLVLVIGNKNYSSWSLRPWLALAVPGIPFEEIRIPLYEAASKAEILRHSAAGKVPVLKHGELVVWESLAICEYVAERFPEAQLWPADPAARAIARAASAEMHAGFIALRSNMPMNLRAHKPGRGRARGVQEDVDRVTGLWRELRGRFGAGGDFLFGRFSIADAMFAPVVSRFRTYEVPLDPVTRHYADAVWALPALQRWREAALAESERIAASEVD